MYGHLSPIAQLIQDEEDMSGTASEVREIGRERARERERERERKRNKEREREKERE